MATKDGETRRSGREKNQGDLAERDDARRGKRERERMRGSGWWRIPVMYGGRATRSHVKKGDASEQDGGIVKARTRGTEDSREGNGKGEEEDRIRESERVGRLRKRER